MVTFAAPVSLRAARCAAVLLRFPNIEKVSASRVYFLRSFRRLNLDKRKFDFLASNLSRDRGYRGLGINRRGGPDRDDGQKCGGLRHFL